MVSKCWHFSKHINYLLFTDIDDLSIIFPESLLSRLEAYFPGPNDNDVIIIDAPTADFF